MMGQPKAGVLYVVATPIGHLGDITRRAETVLKQVQIIAAEDTRRTRVLLDHIGHRAPEIVSLHEHNEQSMAATLLDRLQQGADVALVSDAGTPSINDPGFVLLRAAHEIRATVVPVPGACAITTALSVCPIPCHPFRYVGFLPSKRSVRKQVLQNLLGHSDAIVFFESPRRIVGTLKDLAEMGERRLMLGRELTKKFETILVGTPVELIEALGESPRGEFTCVVEAAQVSETSLDERKVLATLLGELPPSQAARLAAGICGSAKSAMYDLAMEMKPNQ